MSEERELTPMQDGEDGWIEEAILNRFTYHPPKGDQAARYNHLRAVARSLALDIASTCPPSRERSIALTKLEEAVMWANASIARNE